MVSWLGNKKNSGIRMKKQKCHCEEQSKPAPAKAGEAISISYRVLHEENQDLEICGHDVSCLQ